MSCGLAVVVSLRHRLVEPPSLPLDRLTEGFRLAISSLYLRIPAHTFPNLLIFKCGLAGHRWLPVRAAR